MTKRGYTAVAITVVLITAAIILAVFSKRLLSDNKDKALTILESNRQILINGSAETMNSGKLIEKYYDLFGYTSVWSHSSSENKKNRTLLISLIGCSDLLGLDSKEYHRNYLLLYDSLVQLKNFDGSESETENELIFTDAALSFLYDAAYGKTIKQFSYEGVKYHIDTIRIINLLNRLLSDKNPQSILDSIEPHNAQYFKLKQKLNLLNASINQPGFSEAKIIADDAGSRVAAINKLKAYDLLSQQLNPDSVSSIEFKSALISFQKMISADSTGVLDAPTREELNVAISKRISEIKESLNYWRWTNRLQEKEFILVNTSSAQLRVISFDSLRDLSMKVIVGKEDTRTPSFTAYITQVITYPYWTVPLSIATKEMLPKIKKRLSYLDENNLQVVNVKGEEVDPSTIAWSRLSKNYFPYVVRQSTGCDNSLGVMKFDLNSPYSIYLHDTNNHNSFGKKDRHMSHGCVRLEKPKELAHFILDKGPDTVQIPRIDSCMKDQKPNEFRLKKRVPVILLYMTADVDENGNLKFYKDVYGLTEKEKK